MRILTPWTSQPQVPVDIDWSNPITRGIKSAYPITILGARDVISDRHITGIDSSAQYSTGVRKAGLGVVGSGALSTAAKGIYTPTPLPINGLSEFSAYAVVTLNSASTSGEHTIFRCTPSGSTNGVALSVFPNTGLIRVLLNTNVTNGWSAAYDESIGTFVAGVPIFIAFSYRSGQRYVVAKQFGHGVKTFSRTVITGSIFTASSGGPVYFGGASYDLVALAAFDGAVHSAGFYFRALPLNELVALADNPWQIFKPIPRRIFAPVSAATGDGTGIGSLYAITLSSPIATAAGTANATATGSLAASTLTAPTGSASAGTSATATGAFAASSLSAPSATATGSALATGALTTVTLTTIPASATGSALATGSIDQIDLSTVAGNATGTTAGNAEGVGSVATIALSAPAASAIGSALATGSFAAISLGTVSGSASAATDGQATAVIQPISISAPLAIAIASSVATGGIQSIGLTAPTGTASGQAQTIARPTSDISNTGWTPSTGSDLYAMLDEVSPDDADYISTSSVGAVCKFGMNATQYPGGASQQLSLRASSSTGNGILVTIKDGATVIATRSLTLTPSFDLHTITLTSGEIAAITSGNLTVEMTST